MMDIQGLSDKSEPAWDAFVSCYMQTSGGALPRGHFFHLAGWASVIEQGAGQKADYIFAEQDGTITGVMPVVHRNSALFGKSAHSIMFGVYGGPLAVDAETEQRLLEEAWLRAQKAGMPSMDVRALTPLLVEPDDAWVHQLGSSTFIRSLAASDEEELMAIPRKQRAVVRKALKNDLKILRGADQFETFYKLYAISVRNLGTPVFPKKLLKGMVQRFADAIDCLVVYTAQGQAIASCLTFFSGYSAMPFYAGGVPEARRYGAHDFMYFDLMREGRKRGLSHFDFGRSRDDTGPFKFKKNWGFEPTPLPYLLRVAEGEAAPNLDAKSGKYAKAVDLWKKLPLPLANVIGPHLSRHLG